MPSNKDLAAEAVSLAEKLGIEVTTDGLKNQELADLVSDLKAKAKDAEHTTEADQAEAPAAEAPAAEAGRERFVVAPGKSIASNRRGILDAGAEVLPGDMSTESFEKFYELRYIVKG